MPAVAYSPLFLIRPAKAHPVAFTARLPSATTGSNGQFSTRFAASNDSNRSASFLPTGYFVSTRPAHATSFSLHFVNFGLPGSPHPRTENESGPYSI